MNYLREIPNIMESLYYINCKPLWLEHRKSQRSSDSKNMSHKFVRQVSITIRGASSVATDSAQIVLMDQSLAKISDLFDIAYSYQNNMKDVLFTTFFPSMIGIGGIFFCAFQCTSYANDVLCQYSFRHYCRHDTGYAIQKKE